MPKDQVLSRREFAPQLIAAVDEALDPETLRRARRKLHHKALIIAAWYLASFALCMLAHSFLQALVACTSMALAIAAVGFNIQHDANHNAFFDTHGSKRFTAANRLVGWSMYAVGASQKRWIDGHVYTHHSSTNVVGKDYDIELKPFGRLAPQQSRYPWHRFQHLYLWPLYSFTALSILVADVISTVVESFTGDQNGRKPSVREYAALLGTKAAFVGIMVGLPLMVHDWWTVLIGAAYTMGVCGILLGVVFQMAHVVEEAEFCDAAARPDMRWHEWQIRSTVDFCQGDGPIARLVTWYCGGLNYQCEHHLFPQVPHTAYPDIAPVVRDQAARFDIPYFVQPTLRQAIGSHYRHLKHLGRKDG